MTMHFPLAPDRPPGQNAGMKCGAIIFVGLLALVALVAAVAEYWPPGTHPKPGLATFNQVRVGMTLEEVIATVGKSPTSTFKHTVWVADDATLEVAFGDDGRAYYVLVEPKLPPAVPPAATP
jgi:hypothetical protein